VADRRARNSAAPIRLGCCAAAIAAIVAIEPAWSQTKQNAELNELRSRIGQLQKELEKSEENKSEAADALRKSERAISKANRRLFELTNERKRINARIRELERKAAALEKRIESERESLARLIHRQYLAGQPESLRLLLNRQNANETARQLHYFGYVSKARAGLIVALRSNLDELNELAQEVQQESERLQKLEKEEAKQKRALEKQKRARKKVLSKASDDIARQRNEISKLKRDEQRLTELIKKLAAEAERRRQKQREQARLKNQSLPDSSANNSEFRKLKGKLRLPVIGELTNRFGRPRKDSGLSWKGLFIAANPGGEVKAIASGQVVYADWLRGFGNLLILDHGSGYMSLYGNNEALFRQVGDRLGAGETIASVGNSGGNPDSGLYFELRHQGKPFDPLPWVNLK
jgi:murein hydrolase activator